MSEVLYTPSLGGPMERVRAVCDMAEAFDQHVKELDNIENLQEYKRGAYQIEAGNPIIGYGVTLEGHVITPLIDEDGDVDGMVALPSIGKVEGIYRGLELVKVAYFDEEGELAKHWRVVHFVQTGQGTYYDEVGTRFDKTTHAFVAANEIDIQPHGLVNSHSFEYLQNNPLADSLTQSIDSTAFSELPADIKLGKICTLLTTNMHELIHDEKLYQNVFSYIHSLDLLDSVSLGSIIAMQGDDDEAEQFYVANTGLLEFESIDGLCIFNTIKLSEDSVEITDRPGLFYVVSDGGGQVLTVPCDPNYSVTTSRY